MPLTQVLEGIARRNGTRMPAEPLADVARGGGAAGELQGLALCSRQRCSHTICTLPCYTTFSWRNLHCLFVWHPCNLHCLQLPL